MPFLPSKTHYSSERKDVEFRNRYKTDAGKFIYRSYPWSTRNSERRDIERRREAKRERDADLRMIEIADRVFAAQAREQKNIQRSVKRFAHVLKK